MFLQKAKRFLSNKLNVFAMLIMFEPVIATLALFLSGTIFHIRLFTLLLFIVCYCLTVIGITIGFHRYLTHRSFTTGPILKAILIALCCMAYEGPPTFWVGAHRKHHISPDSDVDPHSPYQNKQLNIKTFWHAHMGWMYNVRAADWKPYAKDLRGQSMIRFFNRYYIQVAALGLLIPAVINGLYFMSWYQFWVGFLFCGLFRVFLQHQVTWSINSVCHIWGKRHFDSGDNSKNNTLLGILALGEGWHNGHHAFPGSARHGLLWWQLDISYLIIEGLSLLGLVKNVKVPDKHVVLEKLQGNKPSH